MNNIYTEFKYGPMSVKPKYLYITITILLASAVYRLIPQWTPLPTIDELLTRHGFSLERHYVTTSDGFILENHRIVKKGISNTPGKVVILNHGMLDSSNMWVLFTPNRSLGLYLADRGFDVWLINSRGNGISRKHVKFSYKSASFWNNSWHEIGTHDLPASIDYILNLTQAKKVDFVGFSMGATTFFVLTSEVPQYSQKINRVVALAPAVFDVNLPAMIPYTSYLIGGFQAIYSHAYAAGLVGGFEFHGSLCKSNGIISRIFCSTTKLFTSMIQDDNINQVEYGEAISYIYETCSSLSFLHYYQNKMSGRFSKFDYGTEKNNQIYGKTVPPDYNLKNCKNSLAIFWSEEDLVCTTKGMRKLITSLPNILLSYKIPVKGYTHAALFVATNTEHIVNKKIYEFLQAPM